MVRLHCTYNSDLNDLFVMTFWDSYPRFFAHIRPTMWKTLHPEWELVKRTVCVCVCVMYYVNTLSANSYFWRYVCCLLCIHSSLSKYIHTGLSLSFLFSKGHCSLRWISRCVCEVMLSAVCFSIGFPSR